MKNIRQIHAVKKNVAMEEYSPPKDLHKENRTLKEANERLSERIMHLSEALDKQMNAVGGTESTMVKRGKNLQPTPIGNRYPATPQVRPLTIGTPGSPIGSAYDPRRLESLHGIIRQKDMQSQAAESLIKELRKQNEHLNSAAFQKHGLRTVDELLARANETEKENTELRQEIITLKRIQAKQARALCDMTNTNDYPTKLRFLTDELRHYKNKVEDLKTELLNQQRLCHDYQVKFITI